MPSLFSQPDAGNPAYPKVSAGTTIVGVEYEGGVVLGADTRVSLGTYVCNRSSTKIAPLCNNVYVGRSGSAADTQIASDYVRHFAEQHALLLDADPEVATVAHLLSQINYRNKHLVSAMVAGGWDARLGGQVYGCPIGGTLVRQKWAIDGSGSTYIWGACDELYREGMTREEAEELVITLVALALASDSASGGMCRLVTIDKNGATKRLITPDQFPAVPFEFMAEDLADTSSGGMIID